ncbi:MAG: metallophosphoesterase family protein [Deltaproteobacteria bacterium]
MRIAVVSDTHGHVGSTTAAVRLLAGQKVAAVVHCGDIGSPAIIPLFSAWPAHFVFGNVDHNEGALGRAIAEAGQVCHGRFARLELAGRKIAVLHSDDRDLFDDTVNSGEWDLVCYGHTHVAEQHRVGRTLVLNPGALFRATPHTLAVVDLATLKAVHLPVE